MQSNILLYLDSEGRPRGDGRKNLELMTAILESTVLNLVIDNDRYLEYSAIIIKRSLLEIKKFFLGKRINDITIIVKGISLNELPAVMDLIKSVNSNDYEYQFICLLEPGLTFEDFDGTYLKNDIDFLFSTIEGIKLNTDPQFLAKKLKGGSDEK